MATVYTASIASGYLTDVVYADQGPALQMFGHFVAPDNATAIIETGMFGITMGAMDGADLASYVYSAGANGTYAFIASGLATDDSGIFMVLGF
jgi:hypothetical protein